MNVARPTHPLVPGLLLGLAVALAALIAERIEVVLTGRAWLEALVVAILIGAAVRTAWTPPARCKAGIDFAAHRVLELAVVAMGATVSFGAIAGAGSTLLGLIVVIVLGAVGAGFAIGRLCGLPPKMALLVACGNAICGNSAIAAVAPVIDAEGDDVATSIAFTAVLGIAVVLLLPLLTGDLHLSGAAGGILAGLTVYAVPQVIAAAGPLGTAAVQAGTLVKLVRVLMLAPIVTGLSLLLGRRSDAPPTRRAPALVPPFILAFLALAGLRSLDLLPDAIVAPAQAASSTLTIIAMAGLGLSVDLRSVAAAGPRVVFTVTASLAALALMALAALRVLGLL